MGFSVLLSRVFKSAVKFNLLIVALLLISCGASVDQPKAPSVNTIPAKMLKFLNNGSWRVEMLILDSNNVEVHREEAQVNQETGYVQSGEFFLQPALDYRFIAVFYYKPDLTYELPLGMVVKFVDVGNEAKQVLWEESDIINLNSQIGLNILDKIPGQYLPNLDQDGDGYSNYHEAVAGSDGRDPSSIPNPPQIREGSLEIVKSEDSLEFSVIFDDPLEVIQVQPELPYQCGYYHWELKPLTEDNTQVQFIAKFNLHAYNFGDNESNGTLALSFRVTNGLGINRVYTQDLEYTKTDNPDRWGPEIYIKTPYDGQEVSDLFNIDAVACDENGIKNLQLTKPVGISDTETSKLEHFIGNINPANLGDINQTIEVQAEAINNGQQANRKSWTQTKSVSVKVNNQQIIQVTQPNLAIEEYDDIDLLASVSKEQVPDLIDLQIASITVDGIEDGNFSDLKTDQNNDSQTFKGKLRNTYFIEQAKNVSVKLVASTTSSKNIERTVTFRVLNAPEIKKFEMVGSNYPENYCWAGSPVKLAWDIYHPEFNQPDWNKNKSSSEDLVSLDGQLAFNLILDSNPPVGSWIFQTEEPNYYSTSCYASNYQWELEASRIGLNSQNQKSQYFTSHKFLKYTPIKLADSPANIVVPGVLPEKIQIAINSYDPQDAPSLENLKWQVRLNESKSDGSFQEVALIEGITDAQNGTYVLLDPYLKPRKDYKYVIEFLDPEGKEIEFTSPEYKFTTIEQGLDVWWRLNRILANSNSSYLYNAVSNGYTILYLSVPKPLSLENQDPQDKNIHDGLKVGGSLQYLQDYSLYGAPFALDNNFTFEAWVKIEAINKQVPYLFSKNGQFTIGYNKGGINQQFSASLAPNNIMDCKMNDFDTLNNNQYVTVQTEPLLNQAGWYHLVLTYDQANLVLYVNGQPKATQPMNQPVNQICNASYQFMVNRLDKDLGYIPQDFSGAIGEISVYDNALDANAVKQLCLEKSNNCQ